jgi:hypothetical protein
LTLADINRVVGVARGGVMGATVPPELVAAICKVCGRTWSEHPAPDHAFNLPPVGVVKKPTRRS